MTVYLRLIIFTLLIFIAAYVFNRFIFPLETLTWSKFTSNRVPLSFSYPKQIPFTQCGEEWLSEPLNYLEYVRFSTTCDAQSKKKVYGNIIVKSFTDKTKDPVDLLQKNGFLGVKLNYEKVRIGNVDGYHLVNSKNYFVFNNYEYDISFNQQNELSNSKIEELLKTFHF